MSATPGGAQYVIDGISGTGITGLFAPGGFNGNDNLLFPSSNPLVDGHGFSFSDTIGNTSYKVNLYSTAPGSYSIFLLDNDGFSTTLPVTFTITGSTATPEPSSLLLIGTGIVGVAGMAQRRFTRS